MKIFVTGGTGFIGSYFINRATYNSHELVCLRRPGSQTRINVVQEPEWINGMLDENFTREMEGCEAFIHIAACGVSPQKITKEELLKINVVDSFKLIQSAVSAGIKKIIIVGTSDEYGRTGIRYKFIPPNAPLEPISSYGASKAALFQLLHSFAYEKEIKFIYARIFNAYGIGQYEKNLWPSMRKAALAGEDYYLKSGEQVRTFTSVEEVAKQLVALLQFSNVKVGKPFIINIGNSKSQTIKKFAEFWWKEWAATGKLHFGANTYHKNEVIRYVPLIEELK